MCHRISFFIVYITKDEMKMYINGQGNRRIHMNKKKIGIIAGVVVGVAAVVGAGVFLAPR